MLNKTLISLISKVKIDIPFEVILALVKNKQESKGSVTIEIPVDTILYLYQELTSKTNLLKGE
jgi:hypothetical protein